MQGISGLYSELGRITDMTAGNPVEYRISARAGFRLIFYHAYFNRDQQASLLENANILFLIQKKFKNVYFFKIFFITEKNKLISGQSGHPVSSFPEHPLGKFVFVQYRYVSSGSASILLIQNQLFPYLASKGRSSQSPVCALRTYPIFENLSNI